MSDESLISRYTKKPQPPRPPASPQAPVSVALQTETTGCLERLTAGTHLLLDQVLRNHDRQAMPYAYLASLRLDKSGELKLMFASHMVSIKGRNLVPVYRAVAEHSARTLAEAPATFDAGEASIYNESITINDQDN